MKKSVFVFLTAVSASALFASPVIREGSVTITSGGGGNFRIAYELQNEPALVTFDILTNGVSIGAQNYAGAVGAFGRKIQPGNRTIEWNAYRLWGSREVSGLTAKVKAWAVNNPPPYLVLSFDSATPPMYYESTNAIPHWGENNNRLYKTTKMAFAKVPAKGVRWRMGAGRGDARGGAALETPHYVTLFHDYYMGIYEVTQEQYHNVGGNYSTVSHKTDEAFPYYPAGGVPYCYLRGSRANGIDWPSTGTEVGVNSFADQLRKKSGCSSADLPTEAEWEFACRGGSQMDVYTGHRIGVNVEVSPYIDEVAWYSGNAAEGFDSGWVHEVGLKVPNAYGLYDMLGNVLEVVKDWDTGSSPSSDGSDAYDPEGPAQYTGSYRRVYRGGCYSYNAAANTTTGHYRGSDTDSWSIEYGFRMMCAAEVE